MLSLLSYFPYYEWQNTFCLLKCDCMLDVFVVDLVDFGFGKIGKYLGQIKTSRGVFMCVCVCLGRQNL